MKNDIADNSQLNLYSELSFDTPVSHDELPNSIDGMTPMQRNILWTMHKMKLKSKGLYTKSINVVVQAGGSYDDMSGLYNCSGISSKIYDDMVLMTQVYNKNNLLMGHGNFGRLDDPEAAACPFTDIKLSEFAEDVFLKNTTEKTVKFQKNPQLKCGKAPCVLPARIPGALILGTDTVSNGIASHIPTHNLSEVVDALIAMIMQPELSETDIFDYIKGPDFITGGIIVNKQDLPQIYKKGNGKICVRSKVEVVDGENGNKELIIKDMPPTMIGRIPEFIQNSKFLIYHHNFCDMTEINTLEPEIDGGIMRIVLSKGADIQKNIDYLYKFTRLESSFLYNANLLLNGVPHRMSLYHILSSFLSFYRNMLNKIHGIELNDEMLCDELRKIQQKYAKPRITSFIDEYKSI